MKTKNEITEELASIQTRIDKLDYEFEKADLMDNNLENEIKLTDIEDELEILYTRKQLLLWVLDYESEKLDVFAMLGQVFDPNPNF